LTSKNDPLGAVAGASTTVLDMRWIVGRDMAFPQVAARLPMFRFNV
jgi:hypothetical protein